MKTLNITLKSGTVKVAPGVALASIRVTVIAADASAGDTKTVPTLDTPVQLQAAPGAVNIHVENLDASGAVISDVVVPFVVPEDGPALVELTIAVGADVSVAA